LEDEGKLKAVITQNIDGLHQAAGSKEVVELHGSVKRNHCINCKAFYTLREICENAPSVPLCKCGGFIKPDVVLYGETLDEETVENALGVISDADMLIVGGTSLTVHPAAGLVGYYRGKRMVLINRDKTPYDSEAALIFRANIGEVLENVVIYK
jgi:NAD-dependent deacetylase